MKNETENFLHRRMIETVKCEFDGVSFYLTLGFYPENRVGEIHASGFKHGSSMDAIAQDCCIIITELLQRFVSPLTLTELVNKNPDGSPASLIGAIAFHLQQEVSED